MLAAAKPVAAARPNTTGAKHKAFKKTDFPQKLSYSVYFQGGLMIVDWMKACSTVDCMMGDSKMMSRN